MVINNRNNLKKKNIVNNIFLSIGISSAYSNKITNDIINILILSLRQEKKIKIKNFGTFSLQEKKERIGINPKNKKNMRLKQEMLQLLNLLKD